MTSLGLLAAVLFTLGPVALATVALLDALRPRAGRTRRVWQGLLLASILTVPVLPGIPIASAPRERIFEGPDLLSGDPVVQTPGVGDRRALGLFREEVVRETQGGRLLREIRRDVVVVPLLPLLLGLGWFRRVGAFSRSRPGEGE